MGRGGGGGLRYDGSCCACVTRLHFDAAAAAVKGRWIKPASPLVFSVGVHLWRYHKLAAGNENFMYLRSNCIT